VYISSPIGRLRAMACLPASNEAPAAQADVFRKSLRECRIR
jgi:hypothetical protein